MVQEMSPVSDYRPMQSLVARRGNRAGDSAFGPLMRPEEDQQQAQRSPVGSPKETSKTVLHARRAGLPQITVLATGADFDATRDDMERRRLNQVQSPGQTYLPSSLLVPLADSHNSLLLLSLPDSFEQLCRTLRTLAALARRSAAASAALRSSIFTAWQVLMELPTCHRQCEALREILTGRERPAWERLLPVHDPFLLLYNLILIDRLLSADQRRGTTLKELCVRRGLVEFLASLAFDSCGRGIAWLTADRATLDEWGLQAVSYALLLLTKLKAKEARSTAVPLRAEETPLSPTRCVTPPPSRPEQFEAAGTGLRPPGSSAKRRRRSLHEVHSEGGRQVRALQLRPRSSSDTGLPQPLQPLQPQPQQQQQPSNGLIIDIPAAAIAAAAANGEAGNNFSDISSSSSSGSSQSGAFRLFNIPAIDCGAEGGRLGSPAIVVRRLMSIIEDAVTKE